MAKIADERGFLKKPKRTLISSHFGVKVLVNTDMAKYYLEKGMKITRIYEFIQFHPEKCFEKLADEISDNRREADIDISKNVLGMTSILTGNSLYSATLLNKEKHRNIKYCDNSTVNKAINNPRFVNFDVVAPGVYEAKTLKKTITNDQALQIGLFVYLNAKLHLFQFYYEFMKKFLDPKKYCLIETDTDSIYCALAEKDIDLGVKPELKKDYFIQKLKWMPLSVCNLYKEDFIAAKTTDMEWRPSPCCQEQLKYLKRQPGLFKTEHESEKIAALGPKSYFCSSSNGVNKLISKEVCINQSPLTFDQYQQVLTSDNPLTIINGGFRSRNHQMYSYIQKKRGLTSFYCKRKVLENGVETTPLDL